MIKSTKNGRNKERRLSMANKKTVINMFKAFRPTSKYMLSTDRKSIISRETKKFVCSVDDYVAFLEKKLG